MKLRALAVAIVVAIFLATFWASRRADAQYPTLNRPNIVQCKVIYFGAPPKRIVRT